MIRIELLSFQMFEDFSIIFLFLVSSLIAFWLEDTLYDLSSFKFGEPALCKAQYMTRLGMCSMNVIRMCFLLLLNGMFCKDQLDP